MAPAAAPIPIPAYAPEESLDPPGVEEKDGSGAVVLTGETVAWLPAVVRVGVGTGE